MPDSWSEYPSNKTIINLRSVISKGPYTVRNYVFTEKDFFPEYLPGSEKWRLDFEFYVMETKAPLGGYKLYVTVTPIIGSG